MMSHRVSSLFVAAVIGVSSCGINHYGFARAAGGNGETAADQQAPAELVEARMYKTVHRKWMQMIHSGEGENAIKQLQKSLSQFADPESMYTLAVAYSQLGEVEKSLEQIRSALAAGLPPARFFAGRQQGLEKVAATNGFLELRAKLQDRAVMGPMIGAVSDSSAVVWVRLGSEHKNVHVQYAPLGTTSLQSKSSRLDAANDFVAEIPLSDLQAETRYTYRLFADGKALPNGSGSFRTAAKAGEPTKFRIAFGGGAGYVPQNERMWNTVLKQKPDALLMLGDNVYIDHPQTLPVHWYCYYRRQARPEWRKLVGNTAVYAIWDDHDFADNDSWGGPEKEKPGSKVHAWKIFKNNWVNPGYAAGNDEPGCWHKFSRGDVDVFMLDGRYYRTSPKLPAAKRSMLGPVQLQWLQDELKASRATFKIICSPVPWTYKSKGNSPDTWNGYKNERSRIFDFLTEHKIEGVVLISADRHRSDLWKIDREDDYALYEFNSSKMTNQKSHSVMKSAIFSFNENAFGLVSVDTAVEDPTITYQIVDIDGKSQFRFSLKRSQLQ